MNSIGIFFGTDTGLTRRVAKSIAKQLGDRAAKPVNVAKATVDDLLACDTLILGTPTYGEGALPDADNSSLKTPSWGELVPAIEQADFAGKVVAIYGLGDQLKYPDFFCDALGRLHQAFAKAGATLVGDWSTEGYTFNASKAVVDGRFVGLALDHPNQGEMTEGRVAAWLAQIEPAFK
ncbi:MAG: flavodoxin [Alphaproteobacteria bacterium CG_4_10_14_0_2_um_filter_63_37]|nr:MAG: flavodoxin [Proteobacteria bacterium CG1_02_64_396]PJA24793.1 MAG: flavodoxin [Alphaproteobacteria bacterium CG_4_10_14_0_2_um_filter_63_37]